MGHRIGQSIANADVDTLAANRDVKREVLVSVVAANETRQRLGSVR